MICHILDDSYRYLDPSLDKVFQNPYTIHKFRFFLGGYIVNNEKIGGFTMTNDGLSDKVKGTVNKIKGEAKDQIGNASNDASLQAEGKFEKLKGEAQQAVGEIKQVKNEGEKS